VLAVFGVAGILGEQLEQAERESQLTLDAA
jgi:hypothetical protein